MFRQRTLNLLLSNVSHPILLTVSHIGIMLTEHDIMWDVRLKLFVDLEQKVKKDFTYAEVLRVFMYSLHSILAVELNYSKQILQN